MSRKLMTTVPLVLSFAAATGVAATPSTARPTSPGACNMLHTATEGSLGMNKASQQGLDNMTALVIASEQSGCLPH